MAFFNSVDTNSYNLEWNFRCASPFLELIDEADASEFVSAMRSLIENMTFPNIYQELTKALLGYFWLHVKERGIQISPSDTSLSYLSCLSNCWGLILLKIKN